MARNVLFWLGIGRLVLICWWNPVFGWVDFAIDFRWFPVCVLTMVFEQRINNAICSAFSRDSNDSLCFPPPDVIKQIGCSEAIPSFRIIPQCKARLALRQVEGEEEPSAPQIPKPFLLKFDMLRVVFVLLKLHWIFLSYHDIITKGHWVCACLCYSEVTTRYLLFGCRFKRPGKHWVAIVAWIWSNHMVCKLHKRKAWNNDLCTYFQYINTYTWYHGIIVAIIILYQI